MDRRDVIEVLPHYVAMVILLLIAFALLRTALGEVNFWLELALAFVVVFAYRPVVVRLGIAPSAWTRRRSS